MAWVNQKGGVNSARLNIDTVDYGYQVPRAVSRYKKWAGEKVAAIIGWGTADTEALAAFVAQDQIPFISASYAAALTDPTGQSNKAKPATRNQFMFRRKKLPNCSVKLSRGFSVAASRSFVERFFVCRFFIW